MHIVYDIETYPNVFLLAVKPLGKQGGIFEISDWRNDSWLIIDYLSHVTRMIGFNNFYFDWPILNELLNDPCVNSHDLYFKAQSIIEDGRFEHVVWKPVIEQLDLYLIHHFDNRNRSTGLKDLEFNMRSENIQDLPFEPGSYLTHEQVEQLKVYNYEYDVKNTEKFYDLSLDMVRFRDELEPKFLNYNNTKIGKQIFIDRLEENAPGTCYYKDENGKRQPRQTYRDDGVKLSDIIFPYIKFNHSENFKRTLDWLKQQTIYETKSDMHTVVNGIHIALGGGHASLKKKVVRADDLHTVLDLDVTSYYPSIGIVNRMYPEHLGPLFANINQSIKSERVKHAKGTSRNIALKYALNGSFGDTNNPYSPFLDAQYMLTTTINGQLMLCMLVDELLYAVPECQLIQLNTDGITIHFPTSQRDKVTSVCKWWQEYTCLDLEEVEYDIMAIRDVNNYIARSVSGKTKRKGAYGYKVSPVELDWNKDHSFLIAPKAAEAYFLHGTSVSDFILKHDNPWDFLGKIKVARTHKLETESGRKLQRITRYYAAHDGEEFFKIMPPLPKNPEKERKNRIEVGYKLTECNYFDGKLHNLNYDFYIEKAKKLIF